MDVITVAQLDNHVSKKRFPVVPRREAVSPPTFFMPENRVKSFSVPTKASSARVSTLFLISQYPAAFSFPVVFLAIALGALSLVPTLEGRLGLYRTNIEHIHADAARETSMRRQVLPEVRIGPLSSQEITAMPESITEVSFSEYQVRNGDTVSAIQTRTGLRNPSTLLSVNNIDNARRIRPGQVLRIPSIDGIQYSVVRGDSLERIAARYGIEITSILDANDLTEATLVPGQTLFIPGGSLSTMALRRAMGELFISPVLGRLTSPYGYRKDPFTGVRSFHTGIDIAAPTGTAIKATLDGKVATTGYSPVYGNYVIITHDAGYQSLYGHMSTINVLRGQNVIQGARLGSVGNTGYSTGSHLHFSVYRNGKMVNPSSLLN